MTILNQKEKIDFITAIKSVLEGKLAVGSDFTEGTYLCLKDDHVNVMRLTFYDYWNVMITKNLISQSFWIFDDVTSLSLWLKEKNDGIGNRKSEENSMDE